MRDAGIEEIVGPMIALFSQEAPKGMAQITDAVELRAFEAVERAAHSLKSSAGNVRANALTQLLQSLETAARQGDAAAVDELFVAVRAAYASVMAYLAANPVA